MLNTESLKRIYEASLDIGRRFHGKLVAGQFRVFQAKENLEIHKGIPPMASILHLFGGYGRSVDLA
jgi:hypothetical protein